MAKQTICDICGTPIKYVSSGQAGSGSMLQHHLSVYTGTVTEGGIGYCPACEQRYKLESKLRDALRKIVCEAQVSAGKIPNWHRRVH